MKEEMDKGSAQDERRTRPAKEPSVRKVYVRHKSPLVPALVVRRLEEAVPSLEPLRQAERRLVDTANTQLALRPLGLANKGQNTARADVRTSRLLLAIVAVRRPKAVRKAAATDLPRPRLTVDLAVETAGPVGDRHMQQSGPTAAKHTARHGQVQLLAVRPPLQRLVPRLRPLRADAKVDRDVAPQFTPLPPDAQQVKDLPLLPSLL